MYNAHENLSVGPVVVVGEREHLEMLKEVAPDIMDHALGGLRHNDLADRVEPDVDQNGNAQQDRQLEQLVEIFFRDGIVHRVLDDHRPRQADNASDAAEQQRRQHPPLIAEHIHHNLFQVFKI